MKTENIEHNELIATRVPPGDRWSLTDDNSTQVYPSITDALEAWFARNGEKVEFRLAPIDGKLFAIRNEEIEVKPEPVKRYNIYGDPTG